MPILVSARVAYLTLCRGANGAHGCGHVQVCPCCHWLPSSPFRSHLLLYLLHMISARDHVGQGARRRRREKNVDGAGAPHSDGGERYRRAGRGAKKHEDYPLTVMRLSRRNTKLKVPQNVIHSTTFSVHYIIPLSTHTRYRRGENCMYMFVSENRGRSFKRVFLVSGPRPGWLGGEAESLPNVKVTSG